MYRLFPTVQGALRAALDFDEPATLLVANYIPKQLYPLPESYPLTGRDLSFITVSQLPTQPGSLGIDFAAAFSLCQIAVAVRLHRDGLHDHAGYFLEAALLSSSCVCSVASAEIIERMHGAYVDRPDTFPIPDGILWPASVADWLAGFGIDRDEGG